MHMPPIEEKDYYQHPIGDTEKTKNPLSLQEYLNVRKAALAFQEAFLQWQKNALMHVGQAALKTRETYTLWHEKHRAKAIQSMSYAEQELYSTWADKQHALYDTWAKDYVQKNVLTAMLELQDNIMKSNVQMLKINGHICHFAVHALEQIMAAARQKARLLKYKDQDALKHEDDCVSKALYDAVYHKCLQKQKPQAQALFHAQHVLLNAEFKNKIQQLLAEHA